MTLAFVEDSTTSPSLGQSSLTPAVSTQASSQSQTTTKNINKNHHTTICMKIPSDRDPTVMMVGLPSHQQPPSQTRLDRDYAHAVAVLQDFRTMQRELSIIEEESSSSSSSSHDTTMSSCATTTSSSHSSGSLTPRATTTTTTACSSSTSTSTDQRLGRRSIAKSPTYKSLADLAAATTSSSVSDEETDDSSSSSTNIRTDSTYREQRDEPHENQYHDIDDGWGHHHHLAECVTSMEVHNNKYRSRSPTSICLRHQHPPHPHQLHASSPRSFQRPFHSSNSYNNHPSIHHINHSSSHHHHSSFTRRHARQNHHGLRPPCSKYRSSSKHLAAAAATHHHHHPHNGTSSHHSKSQSPS